MLIGAALLMLANGAAASVVSVAAAQDVGDFDADGYRRIHLRAPVTLPPTPARRIALAQALRLHGALFVDVGAVEDGARDPATGAWLLTAPHATIPGALWAPDAGHAAPDPAIWQALLAAVQAHPQRRIVVFCHIDCWASWNAARHLARAGVRHVEWLAEGIEGWRDAGGALAPAPPLAPQQNAPGQ